MAAQKVALWGAADLRAFFTPRDAQGQGFPFALSWALPRPPQVMAAIRQVVIIQAVCGETGQILEPNQFIKLQPLKAWIPKSSP